MVELLSRISIPGFDAEAYFEANNNNASLLPNYGIAVSGGGYRALLTGAGALAAFDDRSPDATEEGQVGGILQGATYLSGLSGGSWLVGSLYMNNFTTVGNILDVAEDQETSLWQLENSVIEGPELEDELFDSGAYFSDLQDSVEGKAEAGYDTSITDYWGRGLSYQLINATDGGPGTFSVFKSNFLRDTKKHTIAYTYTSIADDDYFVAGDAPLPIIVADGRAPGELLIPVNATNYEFTPWEMGSWDPSLSAFAPLRFIGSNFTDGTLPDDEQCVRGFDNAGFVMGTSSSLFNQFLLNLDTVDIPDLARDVITDVLTDIGEDDNDIAVWPNPFFGVNEDGNLNSENRQLTLVDGGEDLQNIPLEPHLVPERAVDAIVAIDSSADTESGWPNGTALVASFQRFEEADGLKNWGFPYIPDQETFVNLGLNNKPTFFGCDSANVTGETSSPIIIYIPNSPYVYPANVSTFQLAYNNTERNAIIQNGYEVATMGNATRDADWPVCLGCALLARSFERTDTGMPEACEQCMQTFCWNGDVDSSDPPPYLPEFVNEEIEVDDAGVAVLPHTVFVLSAVLIAICLHI